MLNRRNMIRGLFVAPAIIRTPGLLMPIKPFRTWKDDRWLFQTVELEFDGVSASEWLVRTIQDELVKLMGLPPSLLFGYAPTGAVIAEA